MAIDYADELAKLRKLYAESAPQARLSVIRQRVSDSAHESGAARLVTLVSAVEGLARSLLVHSARPTTLPDFLRAYARHAHSPPVVLVEEFLTLHHVPDPSTHFTGNSWRLFKYAVDFRHYIVHEWHLPGAGQVPRAASGVRGSTRGAC